ncbi:hypothetical protein IIU_06000 [Bacillus cereus VD133]|uniref:Uncharacterized protein n=2 Tax=Bacillus cereus TaxID=1396 RepID=A0A9W5UZR3_BACCE|nr:hypothetical protein IIU_06000 [Bacillus cereus VD133]
MSGQYLFMDKALADSNQSPIQVMDQASTNIKNKHDEFAKHIDGFNLDSVKDLKDKLKQGETDAQNEANEWFNSVGKDLKESLNQILSYDKDFNSAFHDIMVDLQQKDKNAAIEKLKNLANNIKQKNDDIKKKQDNLIQFKKKVSDSLSPFSDAVIKANIMEDNDYKAVKLAQTQIDNLQKQFNEIKSNMKNISKQIAAGGQYASPALVDLQAKYATDMAQIDLQINSIKKAMDEFKAETSTLKDLQNEAGSFSKDIDTAITALQNCSNGMIQVQTKLEEVLADIQKTEDIKNLVFAIPKLVVTNDTWNSSIQQVDGLGGTQTTTTSNRWIYEKNSKKWYYHRDSSFKNDSSKDLHWHEIESKKYYINSDGSIETGTGMKKLDGGTYYFNEDDSIVYGWKEINGKKYYFNPEMVIGNHEYGGVGYHFGEDGSLDVSKKGWQTDSNNKKYFYNEDGSLTYGWKNMDGKQYFFDINDGHMVTGKYDTVPYQKNGPFSPPVIDHYYFNEDGTLNRQDPSTQA